MSSKFVVAILKKDPQVASEIAKVVASDLFEPMAVDSTDALYKIVNYQRVDYIIIEKDLDAFVNGLEVLDRTYRDLLRPKSILLAKMTEEEAKKAQSLGVNLILPPDSRAEMLRVALEELKNRAGGTDQVFIHPLARQIVQNAAEIQPLPQLVVKLSGYLSHPEKVNLQSLANDIAVDPKIMGSLLRLINSAAMGMSRKFTKVFDAVNLLGVRKTISLILASTTINMQNSFSGAMSGDDRMWYSKRTILVASTAYSFAQHLGRVSPDTAYILGLFQELGILAMANAFGEKYTQALHRVRNAGMLQLEAVEQATFGVTHADVGGAMLQKWELPPSLISPVIAHHSPALFEEKSETEQRYLLTMRIGEASANLADGFAQQRYPALKKLMDLYGRENAEKCKIALRDSVAKAAESSQLFQVRIPPPEELHQLVEQMIHQSAGA